MNFKKSDVDIKKSDRKGKKYVAILKKDPSKKVHFGAIKPDGTPYEQYKDKTPIKAFAKYDHNDPKRRERYNARHKNDIKKGFNAGYLASVFLW
jgi:hypothetical protein